MLCRALQSLCGFIVRISKIMCSIKTKIEEYMHTQWAIINDYNDFESLVYLRICVATGGTLKCLLTDETYAQSLGFDVKYKSEMGVFPFLHHLV